MAAVLGAALKVTTMAVRSSFATAAAKAKKAGRTKKTNAASAMAAAKGKGKGKKLNPLQRAIGAIKNVGSGMTLRPRDKLQKPKY